MGVYNCKVIFRCLSFSSAANGVYYLKLNETSEIYPVYCHMSSLSAKCGGGAWTLVMKLDKDKVKYIIVNGNQSINQSTNQSINQSINQYVFSTTPKLKSYNADFILI